MSRSATMQRLHQVLTALAAGEFVSGQQLAGQLGLSRAGLRNLIQTLRNQGLDIYAVRGRGYCLANPLEVLDQQWLWRRLQAEDMPQLDGLQVDLQVDSTNNVCLQRAQDDDIDRWAALAERQTQGRGRRGRQWVSPYASQLAVSLLWRWPPGRQLPSGLSLAVGVWLCQALESLGYIGLQLKWPNDVLHQGRKLAGVLIELTGEVNEGIAVVVGVGLNVRMPAHLMQDVTQDWTDISQIRPGFAHSRNQLALQILSHLARGLEGFADTGLAPLVHEWQARDAAWGRRVTLTGIKQRIVGVARGIDAQGGIVLEQDNGLCSHHSGELSLRWT